MAGAMSLLIVHDYPPLQDDDARDVVILRDCREFLPVLSFFMVFFPPTLGVGAFHDRREAMPLYSARHARPRSDWHKLFWFGSA